MQLSRRNGLVACIGALLWTGSVARAQVLSEALRDFKTYLLAASKLVLQASIGLDKIDLHALTAEQRQTAGQGLDTLSNELRAIFNSQSSLTRHIDFYIELARKPDKGGRERNDYWSRIVLPRIRALRPTVAQVARFVSQTPLFTVVLSPEEHLALTDSLAARSVALRSFESMRAPESPDEILELEGLNADYKALIANLQKLRVSVEAARRRLKST